MESSDERSDGTNERVQPDNDHEASLSERELIRKQLSSMSFEELQKLKTRVGAKTYDEVVFESKSKKPQIDFKRLNKNRPREMSSKMRVKDPISTVKPLKGFTARDPRFDPLCGEFDKKLFKSSYKFLKEVKHKERAQLQEELNNEPDERRKKKIQLLLQRIDNQNREEEKLKKQKAIREAERKEIKDKLRKGEKPVFKKKSEKRIEDLVSKYEELKKNNKLEKHFKKHSQKIAKKDRRANSFL